jgi:hypothetical protein
VRYLLDCAFVTQHTCRGDFEVVPPKKKKKKKKKKKATTDKTAGGR